MCSLFFTFVHITEQKLYKITNKDKKDKWIELVTQILMNTITIIGKNGYLRSDNIT